MQKITRVVIPVDNSEVSRLATEQAAYLAKQLNVDVSIIAVDETQQYMMSTLLQRKIKKERESLLDEIKKLVEHNGVNATATMTSGDPAKEIVNHVSEGDLIVMASHGKEGYNKFMIGSVSEEVLHHAPCSVMIIKPQCWANIHEFIKKQGVL